jgi:hypothetical protein
MNPRILVASADAALADMVAAVLADDGYTVLRADRGTPTLAAVQDGGYELLVTDDLAARVADVLLLRYLRDYPGLALPIILLASSGPSPCRPTPPSSPPPSTSPRSAPWWPTCSPRPATATGDRVSPGNGAG